MLVWKRLIWCWFWFVVWLVFGGWFWLADRTITWLQRLPCDLGLHGLVLLGVCFRCGFWIGLTLAFMADAKRMGLRLQGLSILAFGGFVLVDVLCLLGNMFAWLDLYVVAVKREVQYYNKLNCEAELTKFCMYYYF